MAEKRETVTEKRDAIYQAALTGLQAMKNVGTLAADRDTARQAVLNIEYAGFRIIREEELNKLRFGY